MPAHHPSRDDDVRSRASGHTVDAAPDRADSVAAHGASATPPDPAAFEVPAGVRRTPVTWLAYLGLGTFAFMVCVIGPVIPFLQQDLGLSYTVASLHWTLFSVGTTAAGLYAHRVAGRLGRRAVVWTGLAGVVVGAVLLGIGSSLVVTLTGVVVAGLTGGAAVIIVNAILADAHDGPARDASLLQAHVVAGSAAMIAPLSVSFFAATVLGWHAALFLPVLLYAGLWLGFAKVRVPAQPAVHHDPAGRRWPLGFRNAIVTAVFLTSSETCVVLWAASFLADEAGAPKSLASGSLAAFFAAQVVGRLLSGRVAARPVWNARLLRLSIVVGMAGFLVFWLAGPLPVRIAGLAIAGFGISGFYPLVTSLVLSLSGGRTDAASARFSLTLGAALIVIPLLLGAVADQIGLFRAMSLVLVLAVAGFVSHVVLVRRRAAAEASAPVTVPA